MRFPPALDKGGVMSPAAQGENTMIINLTPHDVNVYNTTECLVRDGRIYLRDDEDAEEYPVPLRVYPAAKEPARVTYSYEAAGVADGIVISRWTVEEITGLPEPKPGTWYIVSKIVAQACPERDDLLIPGTMVRDKTDAIVGCNDFTRV